MLTANFLENPNRPFGVLGAAEGPWPDEPNYEIQVLDAASKYLITVGWSPGNWIHTERRPLSHVSEHALDCISIAAGRLVYLDVVRTCVLELATGRVQELESLAGVSAIMPDGNWLLTADEGTLAARAVTVDDRDGSLVLGEPVVVLSPIESAIDLYITDRSESGSPTAILCNQGAFTLIPLSHGSDGCPAVSGEPVRAPYFDGAYHQVYLSTICAHFQSHTPQLSGSTVFAVDEMFRTVSTIDIATGATDAMPVETLLSDAALKPFNRIRRNVVCVDASACLTTLRSGALVHWTPGDRPLLLPPLEGDILLWTPERVLHASANAAQLYDKPLGDIISR